MLLKNLKKLSAAISFGLLLMGASKCDKDAPIPPQNVKVYVAFPDTNEVCRYSDDGKTEECIPANSAQFDGYFCTSPDDHTRILDYIVMLNEDCKEWKK